MSTTPTDARLLPYAFARDHALLARRSEAAGNAVEVWVSEATVPSAITEVSRRYGRVKLKSLAQDPAANQATLNFVGADISGTKASQCFLPQIEYGAD